MVSGIRATFITGFSFLTSLPFFFLEGSDTLGYDVAKGFPISTNAFHFTVHRVFDFKSFSIYFITESLIYTMA